MLTAILLVALASLLGHVALLVVAVLALRKLDAKVDQLKAEATDLVKSLLSK